MPCVINAGIAQTNHAIFRPHVRSHRAFAIVPPALVLLVRQSIAVAASCKQHRTMFVNIRKSGDLLLYAAAFRGDSHSLEACCAPNGVDDG